MQEEMSPEQVAALLRGEYVPRSPAKRRPPDSAEECAYEGCQLPQYGKSSRYCESHTKQLRKKGILSPLRWRKWSSEDEVILRDWYLTHSGAKLDLDELSLILKRSVTVICKKARELSLTDTLRRWKKPKRKYATQEEARAAIGRSTKKHIDRYGHPRGMLGKKHSPETIARLSKHSCEFNAGVTIEQRAEMSAKAVATKLEKYGTAGPGLSGNVYSRTKGGKRHDLGGMYFRSSWEANYARYLNWLAAQGEIQGWRFEAVTFRFDGIKRGTHTYTPDFEVTENDGRVIFHEVKGWMDAKSKTRLKRMKKYYPKVSVIVIGEKEYREISKTVSSLIPNWEFKTQFER